VRAFVRDRKEECGRIAYLRFETEPGRQAQVDFGEFKVVDGEGGERSYYLFSMVLGYSRQLYGEYLTGCDLVSFLEAHQRAFASFGGVPVEVLYDRMRNVFLRKLAGKTEFTQGLLTLADHYGFLPRVSCTIATQRLWKQAPTASSPSQMRRIGDNTPYSHRRDGGR
jgi:transposase